MPKISHRAKLFNARTKVLKILKFIFNEKIYSPPLKDDFWNPIRFNYSGKNGVNTDRVNVFYLKLQKFAFYESHVNKGTMEN